MKLRALGEFLLSESQQDLRRVAAKTKKRISLFLKSGDNTPGWVDGRLMTLREIIITQEVP